MSGLADLSQELTPLNHQLNLRHIQRLYLDTPLTAGQDVMTSPEQAHYLAHVLRLHEGDALRLFNGHDGEWLATLSSVGKKHATLTPQSHIRPQINARDIELIAAPIKKAHFDFMLEKATELGVHQVTPMLTSRTQVRDVNTERCRAMMIEAAEQSDRLDIPTITKPETLNALVQGWHTARQDRAVIVCAEFGAAEPIAKLCLKLSGTVKAVSIITGPEGGFAEEELAALCALPNAHAARLGPRILRADTAAIAALTCWQAMGGDWVY